MSSYSPVEEMDVDMVEPKGKTPIKISTKKVNIPCEIVAGKYINRVITVDRLLENRSAVLYNFLLDKIFVKNKIFTSYMTLPIVLSFVQNPVFIENALLQIHNAFSQGVGIKNATIERDSNIQLSNSLLTCNQEWNTKLDKNIYSNIVKTIQVHCVWDANGIDPFYTETIRSLMFLHQIMGVIDKPSFQEGSDFYVNLESDKLLKISTQKDDKCNSLDSLRCEEEPDCVLRMSSTGKSSCINSERYRTTKPGEKPSYYVLDDPYNEKQLVYRSLCITRVVSGFAGIFQQYDIAKDKKTKANGKYTIVFPPFGGATWKDKIGGIMTFYYNGYISSTRAVKSGRSPEMDVGIMIGMAKAIDTWYESCNAILKTIPKNADIYIVGCSLGGALANVAAFKLLQFGYTNVHMYALGAPRIGDENMARYMNNCGLAPDSANYVRINSIIKGSTFYTQFDPVTKFPVNTWSSLAITGSHLRFTDNGRMRCMEGGLTFNPVLGTFGSQPDYDMMPFEQMRRLGFNPNKGTPLGGDCEEQFGFVHSIPAYSANNFVGARDYEGDGNDYTDYFDRIINLNEEKC
jgi:hypothetical protein